MHGAVSTHRSGVRAVLACVTLLIVTACGGEDWKPPTEPTRLPEPPSPPPPVVWKDLGQFTMTMTAASSCSLPDYAMTRMYTGRLKESGQDLVADFSEDPDFVCGYWSCGFTGRRDGESARFTLTSWSPGGTEYAFIYRVKSGTELGYIGTATGKMDDGGIATTFNGAVVLYAEGTYPPKELARCDAHDHHMELQRK